jgi:hypothetical protein
MPTETYHAIHMVHRLIRSNPPMPAFSSFGVNEQYSRFIGVTPVDGDDTRKKGRVREPTAIDR